MYCLHCFSSKNILERHLPDCFSLNGTQAIDLPAPGSKIFFTNHHRIQAVPFVIYADFEALTEKVDSCQPSDEKSFTTPYQKHRACSYGYKVVCHADQSYSKPVQIYRGGEGKKDATENFIQKMFEEVKSCREVMKMREIVKTALHVIFVEKNIQMKIILSCIKVKRLQLKITQSETIVILQVDTKGLLIIVATYNYD